MSSCLYCNGLGEDPYGRKCTHCKGTGTNQSAPLKDVRTVPDCEFCGHTEEKCNAVVTSHSLMDYECQRPKGHSGRHVACGVISHDIIGITTAQDRSIMTTDLPSDCGACEGQGFTNEHCPECNGSGEGHASDTRCQACKGSGNETCECEQCSGTGRVYNA